MAQKHEAAVEVHDDGGWRELLILLVALFLGGGLALIAWGIWDLFSSYAAQQAFAAAIRVVSYAVAVLIVTAGLALLAVGLGFLARALSPTLLARGVREHGGTFDTEGRVVTLPPGFTELPQGAQMAALQSLQALRALPPHEDEHMWRE